MSANLNPEKALIFRITHVKNLPWILDHGLHCRHSSKHDPNFVNIGNDDLIDKRSTRPVPLPPGGTLSDYIPFYFTPYSIMLYNIRTGWGGVKQRANEEIVILVSSLHKLASEERPFVFTSGHAYPKYAKYFDSLDDLGEIDWPLLTAKDFTNNPDDPEKKERYQAEALVHRELPVDSLLGIVCYTQTVGTSIEAEITNRDLDLKVLAQPTWYF